MRRDYIYLLMTIWMWWGERNTIRTGGTQRPAAMIAHVVRMSVAELMKLNCDAAFSPTTHSGGWGFVIRDADGDVLTAGRGRVDFLLDAF